jgi:hypothetical protein
LCVYNERWTKHIYMYKISRSKNKQSCEQLDILISLIKCNSFTFLFLIPPDKQHGEIIIIYGGSPPTRQGLKDLTLASNIFGLKGYIIPEEI